MQVPDPNADHPMHRIAALITVLALSAGVSAQDKVGTDQLAPGFLTEYSDYDSNGDGIVTLAEVEALVDASQIRRTRACDTNADQRLSISEYNTCNGTGSDPSAASAPR